MADKIVQLTDKDGNNIFPTVGQNVPNMTLTDVDPGEGSALAAGNYIAVYGGAGSLLDFFYPVGCYFETSDTNFNPNTAWGGIWIEDSAGRVTVAYRSDVAVFNTVGNTGGEIEHKLTIAEMPTHNHDQYVTANSGSNPRRDYNADAGSDKYYQCTTGNKGGDQPHNNLQPYIIVKRWHRTA